MKRFFFSFFVVAPAADRKKNVKINDCCVVTLNQPVIVIGEIDQKQISSISYIHYRVKRNPFHSCIIHETICRVRNNAHT
jgi:hypothetical protein